MLKEHWKLLQMHKVKNKKIINKFNLLKNKKHFLEWVNTNNFVTDEDLDQAKVRTLADMDSPVAPSDRGLAFFSLDITPRMKQR